MHSDTTPLDLDGLAYVAELREIAGMIALQPDSPLRWKQYRLAACADYFDALARRGEQADRIEAELRAEVERLTGEYTIERATGQRQLDALANENTGLKAGLQRIADMADECGARQIARDTLNATDTGWL